MRVAQVCPFFLPVIGGVGACVYNISKIMIEQGHEVHVFTSDSDGKGGRIRKKEERIDGIFVHRCKHYFHIGRFASFWPSVYKKLLKGDFDVVHSHNFGQPHCYYAAKAAKKKAIPHFLTTHAPFLAETERSAFGRVMTRLGYSRFGKFTLKASSVIAISEWEIPRLRKLGARDIKVIPNGVPGSYFKKIKNNDFKKKHGIKGDVVLFLGRLEKRKGPDVLLLAAREVLAKRANVFFVFAGPDCGMAGQLKKDAEDFGIEKNVVITGRVGEEDKLKAYQCATVFAIPSKREGLPLTLFEALASGIPIVGANVCGIPYHVKQGVSGFLCDYGDYKTLAKNIIKLLSDKKLQKRIGENNKRMAADYTWEKVTKKILGLYEKAR